MNARVILAARAGSIARATRGSDGTWTVERLLEGKGVECLAADPHNPWRIYAGTQGHGVLRSEDGGATWRPYGMDGQIVKALAVSPHNPDILYAGTKPAYFFASQDGGKSWHELVGFRRIPGRWWWMSPAEKPWTAYVQAIAVSPTEEGVILAGIEFGAVIRSRDEGVTWSAHRRGALRDCHSLKFHSTHGEWAYEAGGTGGGVSYSQDGGVTWRKRKDGLAHHYGVTCAADPAKPDVWYVSLAPNPSLAYAPQAQAYLYRSSGEEDWQPIGWEPHPLSSMPLSLLTDPNAPGHLYAGLSNGEVWHSGDYGETWMKLPIHLPGFGRSMVAIFA